MWGRLGGLVVEHLPSAQDVILESQDQVPHRVPCMEPASPSACAPPLLKKDFIYLFIDSQREAETQAEGEAGSMQGTRCGTPSRVSRITPWVEGGAKPLSHSGCPRIFSILRNFQGTSFCKNFYYKLVSF